MNEIVGGHWNHPRTWGRSTAAVAMGGWAVAALAVGIVHSKSVPNQPIQPLFPTSL
jgi:hypothetical protein